MELLVLPGASPPVLSSPITLVLGALVLAFIVRSRFLIGTAALVLFLLSTPILSTALMRLAEGFQSQPLLSDMPVADMAVMVGPAVALTGRHDATPALEWRSPERFFTAVELVKNGKALRLLLKSRTDSENRALKTIAVRLGLPPDKVLLATADAGMFPQGIPQHHSIIVVTSALEMGQAVGPFLSAGISVTPFPVDLTSDSIQAFSLEDFIPAALYLRRSEVALDALMIRLPLPYPLRPTYPAKELQK